MPPTRPRPNRPPRLTSSRRQFLRTSAAALSAAALSSCGWTLANVRTQAVPQGASDRLHIFTWSSYTDQALLDTFREQTGIEVIADVYDSNEAMLAKLQAGGGAAYSIIYPSDYMVRRMLELGLLRELETSRLSGLTDLFEQFQNPRYDPGNRHSVPMSWGTTGLVYNRRKLQTAPEDWRYLWDNQPMLSRRITLLNDMREVMGATLRMLGYSYNAQDPAQLEAAYEELVKLKPAIASFTSDAWRSQIITGDLLIAMSYSSDAQLVTAENPDLEYLIPQSGSSLWVDTMVIPKSAPNVEAAYAWLNFMMQPSVLVDLCQRLGFTPPSRAAADLLPTELRNDPGLFPPDQVLARCEGIAPVSGAIELYERYWNRLTSG